MVCSGALHVVEVNVASDGTREIGWNNEWKQIDNSMLLLL